MGAFLQAVPEQAGVRAFDHPLRDRAGRHGECDAIRDPAALDCLQDSVSRGFFAFFRIVPCLEPERERLRVRKGDVEDRVRRNGFGRCPQEAEEVWIVQIRDKDILPRICLYEPLARLWRPRWDAPEPVGQIPRRNERQGFDVIRSVGLHGRAGADSRPKPLFHKEQVRAPEPVDIVLARFCMIRCLEERSNGFRKLQERLLCKRARRAFHILRRAAFRETKVEVVAPVGLLEVAFKSFHGFWQMRVDAFRLKKDVADQRLDAGRIAREVVPDKRLVPIHSWVWKVRQADRGRLRMGEHGEEKGSEEKAENPAGRARLFGARPPVGLAVEFPDRLFAVEQELDGKLPRELHKLFCKGAALSDCLVCFAGLPQGFFSRSLTDD